MKASTTHGVEIVKMTSPDRQRRNCSKNQGKPGSGRPWTNSFRLAWIGHRSTCTPKKCLTLLSDALKKDEERPTQLPDITWQAASKSKFWGPKGHRSTCIRNRETPAGFKPNEPKPSVEKVPDVAFWRPKERWRKANATAWHHLTGSVEIEILGPQGAPFNMHPKQGNPSRIQAQPAKTIRRKSAWRCFLTPLKMNLGQRNCLTSPDRQRRIC